MDRSNRKRSRSPEGASHASRQGEGGAEGRGKPAGNGTAAEGQPKQKKKSRFSELPVNMDPSIATGPPVVGTPAAPLVDPIALAQQRAAEIARALGVGGGGGAMPPPPSMPPPPRPPGPPPITAPPSLLGAQLQAQILSSLQQAQATLGGLAAQQQQSQAASVPLAERKPKFKKILLDDKGREIDEEGNLVKVDLSDLRTVKANIAPGKADDKKKKEPENPYLAFSAPEEADQLKSLDPRLKVKDRSRRVSKAFHFVQQGTYVKQAENMRNRERSKILAGFTSGRNPNAYSRDDIYHVDEDQQQPGEAGGAPLAKLHALPPPAEDVTEDQPDMEWWDEPFLPKEDRAKLAKDPSAYDHVSLPNSKTYTYIQHPVPVKGPLDKREDEIKIPTFLTKKERKRLHKQARAEREREKRDKIALGLMPAPAPKMNLSNFMKVLANEVRKERER